MNLLTLRHCALYGCLLLINQVHGQYALTNPAPSIGQSFTDSTLGTNASPRLVDSGGAEGVAAQDNANKNAWLEVKCIGQVSNRSAFGAKVRVLASIHEKTFWQLREIPSGGGDLIAHFGLGNAKNVEMLRIEWPSGIVQIFTNVPPRRIVTVVEHQGPELRFHPSLR